MTEQHDEHRSTTTRRSTALERAISAATYLDVADAARRQGLRSRRRGAGMSDPVETFEASGLCRMPNQQAASLIDDGGFDATTHSKATAREVLSFCTVPAVVWLGPQGFVVRAADEGRPGAHHDAVLRNHYRAGAA